MIDDEDVLVVGAGLAGLRAAQVLNAAGYRVLVFDGANRVGGRLSSRTVEGFVIDEGFQLINPSYPELVATGVLPDLDLRASPPWYDSTTERGPTTWVILERTLVEWGVSCDTPISRYVTLCGSLG